MAARSLRRGRLDRGRKGIETGGEWVRRAPPASPLYRTLHSTGAWAATAPSLHPTATLR